MSTTLIMSGDPKEYSVLQPFLDKENGYEGGRDDIRESKEQTKGLTYRSVMIHSAIALSYLILLSGISFFWDRSPVCHPKNSINSE